MNDVRKVIYGTILGFFGMLGLWFSIIYVSSCGFTVTCHSAAQKLNLTPIPTLIPSSHMEANVDMGLTEFKKCQVAALDLVGAWVSAESPETEPFSFTDVNGLACEATYMDDIQPLFVENSIWSTGSLGCVSCHNAELSTRSAGLDMTTYAALGLGSQRADANAKGTDILGGGDWATSQLFNVLSNQGLTPDGHSADVSAGNPVIFAGTQTEVQAEATATP